ncbi:MAG TPA: YIP1 family protein [Candidatus Bacteroides merdipullorum]|uniref:YIP1 family protein n=1 Tax=Candidatus Bacteroides merdipullorum TaxID=2838474 RepID=A0A9D2CWL3_9BACE|nr:YIP1 family protein [Candidatus Bacteroides merdipullorum]
MDYKSILQITLRLISSPARAWEEIRLQTDKRRVFTTFVYPLIGLCALFVFIGTLLDYGWGGPQSFQLAMTRCCAVAVALFGGYFLAAWLINAFCVRFLHRPADLPGAWQFAGYALVVLFLLRIILGILPDFQIIALPLQFYTLYIVWEGSRTLLDIPEAQRLRFTLVSTLSLILCPWLIEWLFNELTVLLN